MQSIYELGGRNFWIHNADPIGCLPSFLSRLKPEDAKLDSAGCATVYNKLAQRFNSMLNDTVVHLRRELPLASFTYVDIYAARHLLVSQAEEHGKILQCIILYFLYCDHLDFLVSSSRLRESIGCLLWTRRRCIQFRSQCAVWRDWRCEWHGDSARKVVCESVKAGQLGWRSFDRGC